MMNRNSGCGAVSLTKVRQVFAQHRRHHSGGYPEQLQQMARETVSSGHSAKSVASAAGICERSIKNWLKRAKHTGVELPPVELSVAADTEIRDLIHGVSKSDGAQKVCIKFCSGASLEIQLQQLDSRLISLLNRSDQ